MLHELSSTPVMGVSLGGVSLLRLDQTGSPAFGNKFFKLQEYFCEAKRQGVSRLVSFGGVWSNHLHALAAAGADLGIETIGLVRGAGDCDQTAMLLDVRRYGMQVVPVSREEYRQRNDVDYQRRILSRFAPCLLIPEGGATVLGARGCKAIASHIQQRSNRAKRIVLPVGTGTTLAGVAAGLDESYALYGISALKGATDLEVQVEALLRDLAPDNCARWRILHEYHCGGFARTHESLCDFILAFEAIHGIQLEPVYTGKMMYAVHQLRESGEWSADLPLLAIHTGGLQGRRGYSWLG